MWLFTMFDLPTDTKLARKRHTWFRNALKRQGFMMIQKSVYARYFASEEAAQPHRTRVRASLPPEGEVRLLAVTDKQFGKMEVYYGPGRQPVEEPPLQVQLF